MNSSSNVFNCQESQSLTQRVVGILNGHEESKRKKDKNTTSQRTTYWVIHSFLSIYMYHSIASFITAINYHT